MGCGYSASGPRCMAFDQMTSVGLRQLAVTRYGQKRWQKELAAELRTDVSTVRRWLSGRTPIPGPVEAWASLVAKGRA